VGRPFESSEKSEASQLLAVFEQVAESFAPLMAKLGSAKAVISAAPGASIDPDGFTHGTVADRSAPSETSLVGDLPQALSSFITGLTEAAARDFARAPQSQ
jgi:hypothetical protein